MTGSLKSGDAEADRQGEKGQKPEGGDRQGGGGLGFTADADHDGGADGADEGAGQQKEPLGDVEAERVERHLADIGEVLEE
jgi:hypothetical protein